MSGNGQPETPAKKDGAREVKEVGGFELLAKIGQGGMGTVFRARQKSLDRIVALKILPPSVAKDTEFLERFQREARASAKLNHPNIVQGIDVGHDPAMGLWYFAMEYVDGPTLKQVLAQDKVIPEERALKIIRDVATALECVAKHGIVHRDIKPDNILLTSRGEAKLADLGLAKKLTDDASLTRSGMAVGTPHYMAPEQVRGKSDEIDIRTDLYALGATLFDLVTGQPPFSGATGAAIMARHLTDPAPLAHKVNPKVSEATSRMIQQLMQKKKEDRFQTPTDVVQHIGKILSGKPLPEPRTVRTTGPRKPVGERHAPAAEAGAQKRGMGLYAGIGAVVLVGALVFALRGKPQPAVPNPPPAPQPATTAAAAARQPDAPATPSKSAAAAAARPVAAAAQPPSTIAPPREAAVAPPARPASGDAREDYARHLLDALEAEEKAGQLPAADLRLRYEELVRNHGFTTAGKQAAEKLKTLPEPPPEPFARPVLAFSFDGATTRDADGRAIVADLSGRGTRGAAIGAKPAPGVIGEALHFDGADDHVAVAPPPALGPGLTVAAWVNYDAASTAGWQNTVASQDNGKSTRVFQLSTNEGRFCWHRFGNGTDILGTGRIEAERWYHVAATYDAARREHRLYVDGALCGQAPGSFTPDAAEPMYIGRKGTPEGRMFFAGCIDEVAVWSQALSATKIRELYESSKRGISYCRPDDGGAVAAAARAGETPGAPQPGTPQNRSFAAELLIADVLKESMPLLSQNRCEDALALLERKSKDPALAAAVGLIGEGRADVKAVQEMRTQAVEALRKMAGQTVSLRKGNSRIKGKVLDEPKREGVTLNVGGPELTLTAEQLHHEDVDQYAPRAAEAGEDLRRRGVLFLTAADVKAAKDRFTEARKTAKSGLTEAYLDWISGQEQGEVEAKAHKAWGAAEAFFKQKRLKEAEEAYNQFQQTYGGTKEYAQLAEVVKYRLASIAKANRPEVTFLAPDSMKLFPVGYRQMQFPVQETDDATAPFANKVVYFNQKTGTDVVYRVRSPRPLRQVRWKGAAMQKMMIEIMDLKGNILTSGGPYEGANKWAEFSVTFEARAEFLLRFRNHISTWYMIAELELK